MNNHKNPPKWAIQFFRWYCTADLSDAILGDLLELHARRQVRIGKKKADWLFVWNVLLFIQPFTLRKKSKVTNLNRIDMSKHHFKVALRNFQNNSVFSFINVVGLSVSVMIAFLIYFTINYEKTYYDTISTQKQVYQIIESWPGNEEGNYNSSFMLPVLLHEAFPEITSYTRMVNHSDFNSDYFRYYEKNGEEKYFNEDAFYLADTSFFTIFPFQFVYGDKENALKHPQNVVLSLETSIKYFGKDNPVGNILMCNKQELVVAGVVMVPGNVLETFHILARLDYVNPSSLKSWDRNGPTYVLTASKSDQVSLQKKIGTFRINNPNNQKNEIKASIVPVSEVNVFWGDSDILLMIGFVGLFILLIACLNHANLSSALNVKRQKEYGLKKMMGASRYDFVSQYITESVIFIFCCSILSVLLIYSFIPLFNEMIGLNLKPFFAKDFLSSLTIIFMMLTGCVVISNLLARGLRLTSKPNISMVKATTTGGRQSLRFNKINISIQFGISIFLLAGSMVIIKQRFFIINTDLGITYENVLQIKSNTANISKFEVLKNEIEQRPQIKAVSFSSAPPSNVSNDHFVIHEDKSGIKKVPFKFLHVHGDFFDTFQVGFAAGAPFPKTNDQEKGFIINETGLKSLAISGDPIGQEIEFWGRRGPIAGVVKDFHNGPLYQKIAPLIIVSNKKYENRLQHLYVKLDETGIANSISYIEDKITELIPGYPLDYELLSTDFDKRYSAVESINKLLIFASIIGVIISGIGLFGMVLFFAERRTKEIAIRKISGARIAQVAFTMLQDFSVWILSAFPVVCLASWFVMDKWLQEFAYRTTLDWWIFALAGLTALIIGLLTVSYHTIKAASANPVNALRNE